MIPISRVRTIRCFFEQAWLPGISALALAAAVFAATEAAGQTGYGPGLDLSLGDGTAQADDAPEDRSYRAAQNDEPLWVSPAAPDSFRATQDLPPGHYRARPLGEGWSVQQRDPTQRLELIHRY
jgi:hypothetical protein